MTSIPGEPESELTERVLVEGVPDTGKLASAGATYELFAADPGILGL